jgi:hypothetical protein
MLISLDIIIQNKFNKKINKLRRQVSLNNNDIASCIKSCYELIHGDYRLLNTSKNINDCYYYGGQRIFYLEDYNNWCCVYIEDFNKNNLDEDTMINTTEYEIGDLSKEYLTQF